MQQKGQELYFENSFGYFLYTLGEHELKRKSRLIGTEQCDHWHQDNIRQGINESQQVLAGAVDL